ncbi:MFS general substrate transporter [Annulohypoxylon truncatum]|uniref:MFS general substrate transporter n=1 Tax=Annulohypoxylon truncatum TaxID=327061 RepID=UPI002007EF05|nr:MFS general substrate transporter [Annulohypoxylon truncatum]KAI1212100.1 MFS general substrate transporter [Annulohypoxylon truncatum]
MGLGVLEDKHLSHVPGTALLTDVVGSDDYRRHGELATALRHGKGKDSDVVLVPQPSNSPNDPLNWPLWKKDIMLFFICIDTAVVGAWGPMITPGFVEMTSEFGISYNKLNGDLGYGILMIGLSCFFTNSMAVIWGRRPVFLLGNLLLFIGSIGGYYSHNFNSLLGFRLVGCIGMSPFEVLVTATIADIYFVHQRGVRLAAWGLCLSIGVGGGTIISGYIIQNLGWNWTYGICAIIFGVWIIVLFFFCPETAYRRDESLNTDLGTGQKEEEIPKHDNPKGKTGSGSSGAENVEVEVEVIERAVVDVTWSEKKHSYWHDLKIFHGRMSDDPLWKVLTRPLMMLLFPQVLFSFFAYGLTSSWLVVVGSVLAQLFTAPPYNFSVSGVGLVSIASLIGAIVGAFISGPIADWIIKAMSRRNGGIYEPEFRLVLIVITLTLGGMSFFGFGWSLQEQDPWIAPAIFYGLQYFSVGFMSIAVYGYLTDCHRDKAPEAFAAINLRNIYSFGMNYFISDWISSQGPKEVFCIIGGVHVFICICAIPMYIFGKRCRSWTSRVKVFEKIMQA